jgi:hypothetical protein
MKDYVKNAALGALGKGSPFETQQGAINYYSGHVAAWYVYSAGRLEAIARMMDGEEFEDLGHRHAMGFARDWLHDMSAAISSVPGMLAGVRSEQFIAGFEAALAFFDSNPDFSGR